MMYDGQELMHYGVKGMKWGVRRAQKKEYRQDTRERKKTIADVKEAKQWRTAYDRAEKKYQKRLDKSSAKNRSARESDLNALKEYDKIISDMNRNAMSRYRQQTDAMIKKYGTKSIRELKTEAIRGEEYAKYVLSNAVYSFDKVRIRQVDGSTSTRFTPTKTKYYFY